MGKYSSQHWTTILEPAEIGYGHQERTFGQKFRKVLNTILAHLAYRCPSNGMRIRLHRWRGCHIGEDVYLGQYCVLDNLAPEYIYIQDHASVNAGCMILTHFNPATHFKGILNAEVKPTVICENAMVAVRCTIMPGVTVGKFAMASAGMVIDKDVPDYHMLYEKTTVKYINLEKVIKKNTQQ